MLSQAQAGIEHIIKIDPNSNNVHLIKYDSDNDLKYAEIESINVITVIEKQIKEYFQDSKVMELYDELSNLVHPNYNGGWDAYCNLDMKALVVTLESHDKGNIKLTTLTAVYKSLGTSMIWCQELSELLPQFTAREGNDKNKLRSSVSL